MVERDDLFTCSHCGVLPADRRPLRLPGMEDPVPERCTKCARGFVVVVVDDLSFLRAEKYTVERGNSHRSRPTVTATATSPEALAA